VTKRRSWAEEEVFSISPESPEEMRKVETVEASQK